MNSAGFLFYCFRTLIKKIGTDFNAVPIGNLNCHT